MDKVLSLLISVGIITFGAWVAVATIAKGWPLVWTLIVHSPCGLHTRAVTNS